jgi:uncharacterized membrane protein YhaH (DUF805 family)
MNWYLLVWQRYAEFSGRSRRMEYWMFTLYNLAIFAALYLAGVAFALIKQPWIGAFMYLLYAAYALASLVPYIACTVRRLHDIDKSGWWLLIALVPAVGGIALLVMAALDGTKGANQFGPDPKVLAQPAAIG